MQVVLGDSATIHGTPESPAIIENNLAGHVGTPRVMGGGIAVGHHADLEASHLILRDNAVQNPIGVNDCGAGLAVSGDGEARLLGDQADSILFTGNSLLLAFFD